MSLPFFFPFVKVLFICLLIWLFIIGITVIIVRVVAHIRYRMAQRFVCDITNAVSSASVVKQAATAYILHSSCLIIEVVMEENDPSSSLSGYSLLIKCNADM